MITANGSLILENLSEIKNFFDFSFSIQEEINIEKNNCHFYRPAITKD
jgi:hypothetical protein